MRRHILKLGMFFALGLACAPRTARSSEIPLHRPFETLQPWTLPRGEWQAAAGILYRDDAWAPFFAHRAPGHRDEWRLSLVDLAVGLGSGGEARLQFGVQRFAEESGLSKSGIQDARISFAYRLPMRRIDAALQLAVKLPNAPDEQRLGTDETDTYLMAAAGQDKGAWGWASDLGLGILGSPRDAGVQDDVAVLGASAWVTPARSGPGSRVTLLGEIHGMAGSRFGNDVRYARAGVRLGRRIPVDISVRRGLTPESERWGAEAGVTVPSSAWSAPGR